MIFKKKLEEHPARGAVQKIKIELNTRGYLCYLAGGCIRDALLGKTAKDLDIATDCRPEIIEKIFTKTVSVGKSFGVIRVLLDGYEIEIATFRKETGYQDGRHPDSIEYSNPKEDAQRRDFTINALFFDLDQGVLIDEVGGVNDIEKKVIRAVGNPEDRFSEDYLRILRGLRFVSQLDFTIETNTLKGIRQKINLVSKVSPERFRDEWVKLLKGVSVEKAFKICSEVGFFKIYFPQCHEPVIWNYDELTKSTLEDWQYWSLFLTRFSFDYSLYQSFLENLKLSRKDIINLKGFHQSYHQSDLFLKKRLGQIIESFSVQGVYWGLRVFEFNLLRGNLEGTSKDSRKQEKLEKINEIFNLWKNLNYQVPQRMLSGEDLKEITDGPYMGEILKLSYWTQIEKGWSHRESALQWLTNHLKNQV